MLSFQFLFSKKKNVYFNFQGKCCGWEGEHIRWEVHWRCVQDCILVYFLFTEDPRSIVCISRCGSEKIPGWNSEELLPVKVVYSHLDRPMVWFKAGSCELSHVLSCIWGRGVQALSSARRLTMPHNQSFPPTVRASSRGRRQRSSSCHRDWLWLRGLGALRGSIRAPSCMRLHILAASRITVHCNLVAGTFFCSIWVVAIFLVANQTPPPFFLQTVFWDITVFQYVWES